MKPPKETEIKNSVYPIIGILIFLSVVIILVIWGNFRVKNDLRIKLNDFHLTTLKHISSIENEIKSIQLTIISDLHKAPNSRQKESFYNPKSGFSLSNSIYVIEKDLSKIEKLNKHFSGISFESILKQAIALLEKLRWETKNYDANKKTNFPITLESLRLKMLQLEKMHSGEHEILRLELIRKGENEIYLGIFIVVAVILPTFYFIFRLSKQLVKASELERKANHKKELLIEELSRSNKELDDFAFIASHDLKAPLRKIIMFSDRLNTLSDKNNGSAIKYVEIMQKSASKMQTFIDDLLNLSKIQRSEKKFEQVNLGQTLENILTDLEAPITESQAKFEIGNLPIIQADKLQMYQLFLNLLSNALKFVPEGVVPEIRVEGKQNPNNHWGIKVKDNGIGFENIYKERIFQPFKRLVGEDSYKGNGMGLAICKKIIDNHGGSISVESEPQKGSTFLIILPEKQANKEVEYNSIRPALLRIPSF